MLKAIDVLDRGTLALDQLLSKELQVKDLSFGKEKTNDFDGELIINGEKFFFEVVLSPSIAKLNRFISSRRLSQNDAVLIFDSVSEDISRYCKENNVNYLDAAGNTYINAKGLIVYIEGREGIKLKNDSTRIFQRTGLKLLFEIFRNPSLIDRPYRTIAKRVGISTASVGNLMEELAHEKYLIDTGKGKKLNNAERLMIKWVFGYTEFLKPKQHRGYFKLLDERSVNKIIKNSFRDNIFLSGEYGASFISSKDYVKPDRLILYTDMRISQLAKKYSLIPISKERDANSPIEVIEPFWNTSFAADAHVENRIHRINDSALVVNGLIIYADLLDAKNPRSIEIAEKIFKDEIRDRFLKNLL